MTNGSPFDDYISMGWSRPVYRCSLQDLPPSLPRLAIDRTSLDIVEAVRQLARIAGDDIIAGVLNRNGLASGNGNRWTRERVTALRSYCKIPVFKPDPGGLEPWLNLSSASRLLGVAQKCCGWQRSQVKSRRIIRLPTGQGYSSARNCQKRRPNNSGNGRRKTPNTPRHRTRTSKTYSLQPDRKMGAMKQSFGRPSSRR
ncbi:hypothetical protein [Paracoccus homiensis]|uniref:hypothetical protein n=1 Tax=Paracoccus homiensis TaxID=364199 RepID=UPI001C311F42|nr:hypothetical protein [Paracoccus homiensis]